MIDDRYLSSGLLQHEQSGYKYEGEMNVSILDSDFVREVRAEIFRRHGGQRLCGLPLR